MESPASPRIVKLRVRNYRTLRDVDIRLAPFTVFVGANGSGKSTVLDVLSFLSECFAEGLRKALDNRGRFQELRSRGVSQEERISFELKYRESRNQPLITYHLEISDEDGQPVVSREFLQWRRSQRGRPFNFLEFSNGIGRATSGDMPDEKDKRVESELARSDLLAVNALGQFQEHPRVKALREFITDWRLFYLSSEDQRGQSKTGPQEHLSRSGDNLANVVQFLQERHPQTLTFILKILQRRIPRLESIIPKVMEDGRLLLRFKDEPFDESVQARFISDGTLKMLSYLLLLHDPDAPPLIGIEEPENYLHPKLLHDLAEDCQKATTHSQFLTTTHSREFLNAIGLNSVRFLGRDKRGYTKICSEDDMQELRGFVNEGGRIGDLWMEGYVRHGDPTS